MFLRKVSVSCFAGVWALCNKDIPIYKPVWICQCLTKLKYLPYYMEINVVISELV